MAQRLASFSIMQTAKVCGVLYGLMGLCFLPILFLVSMFGPSESRLGFVVLLVIPVMYAFFGFVFTVVGCALYNWVAGMVGGIEMTFDSAE